MADNYDEHVHNAAGAGGRFITRRSVEVATGIYADVVVSIGEVAPGAPDSANPLSVGGRAASAVPAAVDVDDLARLWLSLNGAMIIAGVTSNGADATSGLVFPDSAGSLARPLVFGLWNGASFDRQRNNLEATLLASAARTATVATADQTNYNHRGGHIVIDVTAIAATPSVVATVQGKDPLSGQYYTILASAAITGVSTTILRVYPGMTAAANLAASDILPRTWRVNLVHADADSITYSVGFLGVV